MSYKIKHLEEIAKQNHWNNDRHTLFILREMSKKASFPGEQFALRRAIKIIKGRKP